jgi:hypothetical protein
MRKNTHDLSSYHLSLITLSFCAQRFNMTRHVDRERVARRPLSLNTERKALRGERHAGC